MTCLLFSHARVFHASLGKTHRAKSDVYDAFVLNGLVLSLLSLKRPFCPVCGFFVLCCVIFVLRIKG